MKKTVSLLLACIMIFMICGSNRTTVYAGDFEKAIGIWKLVEMTGEENQMSKEDIKAYEAMGIAMYLKLRENGTAKFSLFGEDMEGTWNEYNIVLDNEWLTYILDKDQLIVDNQDGGGMIFDRSSMDEIYQILGYKKGVLDENVKYTSKDKEIFDSKAASVTVKGYEADMTGFTVKLRCKNKTRNPIVISGQQCALNKYIFHPEWDISLDPRETLDSTMTISPADLEKSGISSVDEMILQLTIRNADNDKVIQQGIWGVTYPTGKKAADVKAPARTPVENEALVNNDNASAFIIQSSNPNDERGFAVNCFLQNKSVKILSFVWSNVTINGASVNTSYEETTYPGTMGYSDVIFLDTELEDLGIISNEITEIKGILKVYDKTQSTPAIVAQKEFTYKP